MLRRIAVLGMMLFALLGLPRSSHAGLLELIWEMSGPQMIGSGISCIYSVRLQRQECRIGGMFLKPTADQPRNPHGPFLVIRRLGLRVDLEELRHPGLRLVRCKHGRVRTGHNGFQQAEFAIERRAHCPRNGRYVWTPVRREFPPIRQVRVLDCSNRGFCTRRLWSLPRSASTRTASQTTSSGLGLALSFNRPAEATYGFSFSYIYR